MKRIIIVMVGVLFTVGFFAYRHQGTTDARFRVAIITPVTHQALQRIEHSFMHTLDELVGQPVAYTVYNAQGKKTLLHAQVAQALAGGYDLMVTLASGPTLMACALAEKNGAKTPLVFAAVAHPERNGIVQTRAITGVVEQYDPHIQVRALRYFKPACKKVLVIYDPTQTPELRRDAHIVTELLHANGISVFASEVVGVADLVNRFASLVNGVDAVLVLIDNTVVSGIDVLIKRCNQLGIPLIASDLDSGMRGASLAVGVHQDGYGQVAAKQAFEILVNKKAAAHIPYQILNDQVIQVNTTTMQTQRLTTSNIINSLPHTSADAGVVCVTLP